MSDEDLGKFRLKWSKTEEKLEKTHLFLFAYVFNLTYFTLGKNYDAPNGAHVKDSTFINVFKISI